MALLVQNVRLGLDEPEEALVANTAKRLRIPAADIQQHTPVRRSLDARKQDNIHFVYHVEVTLTGGMSQEKALLKRRHLPQVRPAQSPQTPELTPGAEPLPHRPVVVGFGPAGMLAAYKLAQMGYQPLVLERGRDVKQRHHDVLKRYYREGIFDPDSNLLFGEGGAGTYSDGKLYTRVSDPLGRVVLETLYRHGADASILIDAKPHVGSEKLPTICRRIRLHIEEMGGQIEFGSAVDDVRVETGRLTAIRVNQQWRDVGPVILAIGHSARDTLRMLAKRGVALAAKPFQMGVRIEHPQAMVDRWQYGQLCGHSRLPPADYQLVAKTAAGALGDMFSFCMCPGGLVLPSNESAGLVATNGASPANRGGPFANAGLVVTVPPAMVGDDPLAGLDFQQRWEEAAFAMTGGSYQVPAQRASDYLQERTSTGRLDTSFPLGGRWGDMRGLIPAEVSTALEKALLMLDQKMPGYAGSDAIIMGPETRASSPVRILRDNQTRQAVNTGNLYPVGEGAGYAGGIVSSAIDGLKTAHALIGRYAPVRK